MAEKINGIILTPLKIIPHEKGNIFHAIRNYDVGYFGFGEAYFSTIKYGNIKAWKKHTRMTLNLVVPVGKVLFTIYDDIDDSLSKGLFEEIIISPENYFRLTIPPKLWYGFKGLGKKTNLILNIADIPHEPDEQVSIDPSEFTVKYNWEDKK